MALRTKGAGATAGPTNPEIIFAPLPSSYSLNIEAPTQKARNVRYHDFWFSSLGDVVFVFQGSWYS